MTKKTHHVTVWLCEDCTMAAHELSGEVDPDHVPDREPLSHIAPGDTLTPGLHRDQHQCGVREFLAMECDCERVEFSKDPCDGCGSPLAGRREGFTLWYS